MIFSEAGCLYSVSPIVISAVCRHWHEVAIGTPTLWSNISPCISQRKLALAMFLARSRRAPLDLHIDDRARGIWIKDGEECDMILNNSERIHCLSIRGPVTLLQWALYPNLERLGINFPKSKCLFTPVVQPDSNSLHPSLFPRLRILEVGDVKHSFVTRILIGKIFPQLQGLSIPLRHNSALGTLPLNGAHNLVSFTVIIHTKPPEMEYLILPQLRHLKVIENTSGKSSTTLYIDAANLESVHRVFMPFQVTTTQLVLNDAHSVKYLCTSIILEMKHYPGLEELWLEDLYFTDRRTLIPLELHSGLSFCPELKVIEFIAPKSNSSEGRDAISSILKVTPKVVRLSVCEPGDLVLPGSIVPMVATCRC